MVIILLCIIPSIASIFFGWHLKAETVSATLGLLVGISGAVFTIMSIWIAFLYPNVLRVLKGENLVNADFSSSGGDTTRLKIIVGVIIQSALSMAFALLGMLFVSFYDGFGLKTQELTLTAMQFLIVFFSGLQISAILSVIHINSTLIKNLEGKNKARARDWDT